MIRAILFDLGNTLLEYEARPFKELFRDATELLHGHLVSRGLELPDAARFAQSFDELFEREEAAAGAATHEVVIRTVTALLERTGVSPSSHDLPEMLYPFYEAMSQQVIVYPDTLGTLVQLRSAGYKLGLVANTIWPKEFHLRDLARYEMLSLFDTLIFSSDVGVAKPSPAIFHRALEALDIDASAAVFVGDDPKIDVDGGHHAGLRTILKFHPRHLKSGAAARPDARIDALKQLPALIDEWKPALA